MTRNIAEDAVNNQSIEPTLTVLEPEIARGHVYSVFRGNFGAYPSVYAKKVERDGKTGENNHRDLAMNDISMMQKLACCPNIARVYWHIETETHIIVVVENYRFTCKDYLLALHKGEIEQNNEFDVKVIFKQLFKALQYIHRCKIVHRDIRLKNIFIHQFGKQLLNFNL